MAWVLFCKMSKITSDRDLVCCRDGPLKSFWMGRSSPAKMVHIPPPFYKNPMACVFKAKPWKFQSFCSSHSSQFMPRCSFLPRPHPTRWQQSQWTCPGRTETCRINNEVLAINILCTSECHFMCTKQTVDTGIMPAQIQRDSEGGVVTQWWWWWWGWRGTGPHSSTQHRRRVLTKPLFLLEQDWTTIVCPAHREPIRIIPRKWKSWDKFPLNSNREGSKSKGVGPGKHKSRRGTGRGLVRLVYQGRDKSGRTETGKTVQDSSLEIRGWSSNNLAKEGLELVTVHWGR